MKVLVLWSNNIQPNLGVRALAHGSEALVKLAFPQADVRFRGLGAEGDGPINIGHIKPLLKERVVGRKGLMEWLSSFDLVLDTRAGDSFTDIYGMRRLAQMSVISEFARQAGVPVALGPQTIGPFQSARARLIAKRVLQKSDIVMTRDPKSAEAAAKLGRPVDVVATDVVFALPRPEVARSRDVMLNVSGLLWEENPHVPFGHYRDTVVNLVRTLEAEGRSVSLLTHVLPAPTKAATDSDLHAVQNLDRILGGSRELLVPEDLWDVRRMVASASVVVGARMHACLNALSVGTPAVPMAYSRKFAPLLDALGWKHTVNVNEPQAARMIRDRANHVDLASTLPSALTTAGDRIQDAVRALRTIG